MSGFTDFISQSANAAALKAVRNYFESQSTEQSSQTNAWFVGTPSQDLTTVTHPNGTVYNLVFTGTITGPGAALIITPDVAFMPGTTNTYQEPSDAGRGVILYTDLFGESYFIRKLGDPAVNVPGAYTLTQGPNIVNNMLKSQIDPSAGSTDNIWQLTPNGKHIIFAKTYWHSPTSNATNNNPPNKPYVLDYLVPENGIDGSTCVLDPDNRLCFADPSNIFFIGSGGGSTGLVSTVEVVAVALLNFKLVMNSSQNWTVTFDEPMVTYQGSIDDAFIDNLSVPPAAPDTSFPNGNSLFFEFDSQCDQPLPACNPSVSSYPCVTCCEANLGCVFTQWHRDSTIQFGKADDISAAFNTTNGGISSYDTLYGTLRISNDPTTGLPVLDILGSYISTKATFDFNQPLTTVTNETNTQLCQLFPCFATFDTCVYGPGTFHYSAQYNETNFYPPATPAFNVVPNCEAGYDCYYMDPGNLYFWSGGFYRDATWTTVKTEVCNDILMGNPAVCPPGSTLACLHAVKRPYYYVTGGCPMCSPNISQPSPYLQYFPGNQITVGGSAPTGVPPVGSNLMTVNITDSRIPGGTATVTYIAGPNDTPATTATGIQNAINASVPLQVAGITSPTSGGTPGTAQINGTIPSNTVITTSVSKQSSFTLSPSNSIGLPVAQCGMAAPFGAVAGPIWSPNAVFSQGFQFIQSYGGGLEQTLSGANCVCMCGTYDTNGSNEDVDCPCSEFGGVCLTPPRQCYISATTFDPIYLKNSIREFGSFIYSINEASGTFYQSEKITTQTIKGQTYNSTIDNNYSTWTLYHSTPVDCVNNKDKNYCGSCISQGDHYNLSQSITSNYQGGIIYPFQIGGINISGSAIARNMYKSKLGGTAGSCFLARQQINNKNGFIENYALYSNDGTFLVQLPYCQNPSGDPNNTCVTGPNGFPEYFIFTDQVAFQDYTVSPPTILYPANVSPPAHGFPPGIVTAKAMDAFEFLLIVVNTNNVLSIQRWYYNVDPITGLRDLTLGKKINDSGGYVPVELYITDFNILGG